MEKPRLPSKEEMQKALESAMDYVITTDSAGCQPKRLEEPQFTIIETNILKPLLV